MSQGHVPDPQTAAEGFNAGEVIIGHVSNGQHPIFHLPTVWGIDLSVTKHVFMLWLVAAIIFVVVTSVVQRYIKRQNAVPSGTAGLLEVMVDFVRDGIARPNFGGKWTNVWTPFLLSLFLFILGANVIGLIPIFDVLALFDHYVLHSGPESFMARLIHGGSTATGNFNVTAGLATVSFFAIIAAGSRANGVVQHWVNLVPKGHPLPLYVLLIPLEIIGLFVRPFALTMRLAANMTGGHIALLVIMSFVFIFSEMAGHAYGGPTGIATGVFFTVPLAVGISGLEIIVVLVQAYVFTLLTAVFMGMAVHSHH